jgi:hypothetical protein
MRLVLVVGRRTSSRREPRKGVGGMRFVLVILMLAVGVACWNPHEVNARPVKGNKTLSLSMNQFSWSKTTYQTRDHDGNNRTDEAEGTSLALGLGASGGYLLTDMIELGIGASFVTAADKYVPNDLPNTESKLSSRTLQGHAYGKVHLGSSKKLVPFASGELGLMVTGYTAKYEGYAELHKSRTAFWLSGKGGIDYYVADKYAITGCLGIARGGTTLDSNTKSDQNPLYGTGGWTIDLGLGITTYF